MKQLNKFLILGGAYLIVGGLLAAQAPPGPLTPPPPDPNAPVAPPPPKKPEVQPRKTILGYWKFNKDESDDGRAKLRQSREADNANRGTAGAAMVARGWVWAGQDRVAGIRTRKVETFPTATATW